MAAVSKASFFGRSLSETAGSNPAAGMDTAIGVPRGGLGCSTPPRNSENIGGVLDRMSKKNRRLDFLL